MTRTMITGAANGIGRATALLLAREPDAQLLLIDRDGEALERATTEVREAGATVCTLVADVAQVESAAQAAGLAEEKMGGLDGLFSNVGYSVRKPLAELTVEEWDQNMNVHARACWLFAKACRPALLRSDRAAVVATASISGVAPHPGLGTYSTGKAATIMLCQQLALEWAPDGIRVNVVSPGTTQTLAAVRLDSPGRTEKVSNAVPLGRRADAEEIAQVVVFLLSPLASYLTGANVVADGGLVLTAMERIIDR